MHHPSADDETYEPTGPDRSTGGSWLLFMGGLGLVLFGAALVTVPLVAQPLAWISAGFAKHGVQGAPAALAGIVMFGLWIATRALAASRRDDSTRAQELEEQRKQAADQARLLEQVASDLALTRGGMQELRVEFVYLKDQVQSAQREGVDPTTGVDEAQAAIFRLAASMDQLGGRLDQRLRAQDTAVHEVMGLLRSEISQTTASLTELRSRIEQGIEAASTSVHDRGVHLDGGPLDGGQLDEVDFGEIDEIDVASGYVAADDDLMVEVELEPDGARGLGLLDELDDLGTRRDKTSPSIRPSIPRTNTYSDLDLDDGSDGVDVNRVVGALPARGSAEDDEVDAKLATLRALMSDPSVRRALEAARHRA